GGLAQRALADREGQVREGMGHDRRSPGLVDPRERLREGAEHGDLVLDPEREKVARSRRHFDARNDGHRARPLRRELAQRECTANVVVIGQRDHVEPGPLRSVEDLLDRRKTVTEVAVQLQISPAHLAQAARLRRSLIFYPQTRSKTVHCSGWSLMYRSRRAAN